MPKAKPFMLSELPDYTYPLNVACPSCYAPLHSLKRVDGRCDKCRRSKDLLPVNYIHVKRKKDDEDEVDRKNRRRYNSDDD